MKNTSAQAYRTQYHNARCPPRWLLKRFLVREEVGDGHVYREALDEPSHNLHWRIEAFEAFTTKPSNRTKEYRNTRDGPLDFIRTQSFKFHHM